jgi:hypothetical protein
VRSARRNYWKGSLMGFGVLDSEKFQARTKLLWIYFLMGV